MPVDNQNRLQSHSMRLLTQNTNILTFQVVGGFLCLVVPLFCKQDETSTATHGGFLVSRRAAIS
jgi:hypothetical protein